MKKESPIKWKNLAKKLTKENTQSGQAQKPAESIQIDKEKEKDDISDDDNESGEDNDTKELILDLEQKDSEKSETDYEELLNNFHKLQEASGGTSPANLIDSQTSRMCKKKNYQVQGIE